MTYGLNPQVMAAIDAVLASAETQFVVNLQSNRGNIHSFQELYDAIMRSRSEARQFSLIRPILLGVLDTKKSETLRGLLSKTTPKTEKESTRTYFKICEMILDTCEQTYQSYATENAQLQTVYQAINPTNPMSATVYADKGQRGYQSTNAAIAEEHFIQKFQTYSQLKSHPSTSSPQSTSSVEPEFASFEEISLLHYVAPNMAYSKNEAGLIAALAELPKISQNCKVISDEIIGALPYQKAIQDFPDVGMSRVSVERLAELLKRAMAALKRLPQMMVLYAWSKDKSDDANYHNANRFNMEMKVIIEDGQKLATVASKTLALYTHVYEKLERLTSGKPGVEKVEFKDIEHIFEKPVGYKIHTEESF